MKPIEIGTGAYQIQDGKLVRVRIDPIPYYDICWTRLIEMTQATATTWILHFPDSVFVAHSKEEMLAKLKELIPQP